MATKNEQTGMIGEKLVEIELLKRNINFWEMTGNNSYFDLIIDTKDGLKKVQIKTANETYNDGHKKGKFNFYLMNCAGAYDYLILVTMFKQGIPKFYILPESEVGLQKGITIALKNNKYSKFKGNWSVFL